MDTGNPPALPVAIAAIIAIFDKHASSTGGNPHTLSFAEAKALLEEQMAPMCQEKNNTPDFAEILKSLDMNGDGELDMMEFMTLLTCYTSMIYGTFCDMKKKC